MENYEINILKRNGDWKKINPINKKDSYEQKVNNDTLNSKSEKEFNNSSDLLSNINEVKLIVDKIENLEKEKNNLKNNLKNYEKFFLENKIHSEEKIYQVSKELEIFDKAIEIIKDLKKF